VKTLAKRKYNKQVRDFLDSFRRLPCTVCGLEDEMQIHGEHVKTIGSGGPVSDPRNVMAICLIHHDEKNRGSVERMAKKYTRYRNWLILNGWEKLIFTGKWINVHFT